MKVEYFDHERATNAQARAGFKRALLQVAMMRALCDSLLLRLADASRPDKAGTLTEWEGMMVTLDGVFAIDLRELGVPTLEVTDRTVN